MQILNVEPIVYDLSTVYIVITVLCFGIGFALAMSFITDWANTKWKWLKFILSIVISAIAVTGAVFALIYPKIDTGKNRYEVVFDDEQSIQDIYDRYIVVEQRGKIWVLEDKERK